MFIIAIIGPYEPAAQGRQVRVPYLSQASRSKADTTAHHFFGATSLRDRPLRHPHHSSHPSHLRRRQSLPPSRVRLASDRRPTAS